MTLGGNSKKVCFLLTHVPNPRINKRIDAFKQIMETEVICTRRASQNLWEPQYSDVKHTILDIDLPKASQIFKRIIVSKQLRKKLYCILEESKPTVIYSEGLDTLMIAVEYKKKFGGTVIFETSDLREEYIEVPKGIIKKIVSKTILYTEKYLFRYVDRLVITSPKFYDLHYKYLIRKEKVLFFPNIPDVEAFKGYHRKDSGPFTIGFIGGIRYLSQMKMLVDAASALKLNVLFAGIGFIASDYECIREYCKDMKSVIFTGRYDYAKDIAKLYSMVDCVYSVYDADNANVRIALPNKLYESIYCGLPIIVSKGTYLAELVDDWGVGIAVGHTNTEELKNVIKKLHDDKEYYENIVERCKNRRDNILKGYDEIYSEIRNGLL